MNGYRTLGENIADYGGVKLAYATYKKSNQNGPEPTLPGLNYTSDQLFWIAAAQKWCAVTRPEYDELHYGTFRHSPSEFRVIGTFSNANSFLNDFKCKRGSEMFPKEKCELW